MATKRIAYKKSNIDRFYHWKHFGSHLGLWALTNYYIIQQQGFPQGKEKWILFILLNVAFIFKGNISLQGGKKVSG